MYARSVSILLALPLLASAAALRRGGGTPTPTGSIQGSCNPGGIMCCDSAEDAWSSSVSALLGLLNINAGDVTGLVGVNCTPITAIGAGQISCVSQPLCCTNNSFKGVVAIGCNSINI